MNEKKVPPVPKVGQEIYVNTHLFLSHGEDDVLGGRATVIEVLKEQRGDRVVHEVKVKEHPGYTYYWEHNLAECQEDLKKKFDDQRAKPIPDHREEFNRD